MGFVRLADLALRLRPLRCLGELPVEELMTGLARHSHGPIVVAAPSDSVGASAPGDGTGLLRALVEHRIANAAVVINDP